MARIVAMLFSVDLTRQGGPVLGLLLLSNIQVLQEMQ